MAELLIKVLGEDGVSPIHGGSGAWSPPIRQPDGTWLPGEWRAVDGPLVRCQNGLHLATPVGLPERLGPTLYLSQVEGEHLVYPLEVVARRARLVRRLNWDDRSARLFACDCVERVLPLYETLYPRDARPRGTIETARRFANGEAAREELAAAWAAARAAAEAAARAAWAAESAAEADARAAAWAAARAAWAAAGTAAKSAARAAWAAAGTAAWDTERAWQTARLMAYLDLAG